MVEQLAGGALNLKWLTLDHGQLIPRILKQGDDSVGFEGALNFDESKPDGTPRKLLDVSLMRTMGWRARTSLEEGLNETYRWYVDNHEREPALRRA